MSQVLEHDGDVRIHIDQRQYHSPRVTTGKALHQLGQVESGMILLKEVQGDKEDPEVRNDDSEVLLKEDEHFHSGKPRPHAVEIFVNTDPVVWEHPKISYEQLVKLGFPNGPIGPNVIYSITWTKPDWQEGALDPGQSMHVVEGIAYDVRNTDKS